MLWRNTGYQINSEIPIHSLHDILCFKRIGESEDEWAGKVEIEKVYVPWSKRSIQGYILTYFRSTAMALSRESFMCTKRMEWVSGWVYFTPIQTLSAKLHFLFILPTFSVSSPAVIFLVRTGDWVVQVKESNCVRPEKVWRLSEGVTVSPLHRSTDRAGQIGMVSISVPTLRQKKYHR